MEAKNPFQTLGMMECETGRQYMNLGTWFIDVSYHETSMFPNSAFTWKIPPETKKK